MPRFIALMFPFVICCFILAGCWDRRELNELGITSATGIDWSDGKWRISYQVIVPSGMGSGDSGGGSGSSSHSTVHVFSTEGSTIREAASKSNLEIPRQLYFAHTDTVIIGKKAAEHGLSEVVELYLRSVEARETVMMAVTEESASAVLKLFVPMEKVPGDALNKIMLKQKENFGYYPAVRVVDFARGLYSDSRATSVPEINLKGKRDNKARKELSSLDIFKKTFSGSKLTLTGLSVFKDARRVGRLDPIESFGVSWLSDNVRRSIVAVPCPGDSDPNAYSTFRIEKVKTKVTPQKKQDRFQMLVQADVRGELLESECKLDLTKNEGVRKLSDSIEQHIEGIMETGWKAVQRLNADLPGFADKIHRKYPMEWKRLKENWSEQFPKLAVDTRVRVSVIRIGLSHKPLKQDRSNVKG
jgi:germination protein, Ger(x)C family